jgi:hypothetical protein
MTRAPALVVLLLLAAVAARADIPVPPPPGKKFVGVENRVTTDKAYPDLEFYVLSGSGAPAKVALAPDAPIKVPGDRRVIPGGQTILAAVPRGAAEKFPDGKAFAAAVRGGKVPGQAVTKHVFSSQTTVATNDPRPVVVQTYAVVRIDAKGKGEIVLALEKAAGSPPPMAPKNAPAEDEPIDFCGTPPPGNADLPRGGAVVAGLALAVAAASAGVWLRRRGR